MTSPIGEPGRHQAAPYAEIPGEDPRSSGTGHSGAAWRISPASPDLLLAGVLWRCPPAALADSGTSGGQTHQRLAIVRLGPAKS